MRQLTIIEYWVLQYNIARTSEDKELCKKKAKSELSQAMYEAFINEIE